MMKGRFFVYVGRSLSLRGSAINLERDGVLRWRSKGQSSGVTNAGTDDLSVQKMLRSWNAAQALARVVRHFTADKRSKWHSVP